MSLAFDMCRCKAAHDEEGNVLTQCNNCRRYLEQEPSGPRSPWFVFPPLTLGDECDAYMPKDDA
jgi:hypothetical protein